MTQRFTVSRETLSWRLERQLSARGSAYLGVVAAFGSGQVQQDRGQRHRSVEKILGPCHEIARSDTDQRPVCIEVEVSGRLPQPDTTIVERLSFVLESLLRFRDSILASAHSRNIPGNYDRDDGNEYSNHGHGDLRVALHVVTSQRNAKEFSQVSARVLVHS